MRPTWYWKLICALKGHTMDIPHGAHDHLAKQWSRTLDSTKTRCLRCGATFYKSLTRNGQRGR